MRVLVDRERCHGNANCLDECPEVFELGRDDKVVLLVEHPPASIRDKVKFAALCCPRFAITVIDETVADS